MARSEAFRRVDEAIVQVIAALPGDRNLGDWVQRYAIDHRYRLAEDLLLLAEYVARSASILEFGSAPYFLTLAAQYVGYRVHGLDIAPERFDRAIRDNGLSVDKVNFETEPLPFRDESFDVVLFNEVFEHLRIDLIGTMSKVHQVLKPGGLLFLCTPNHRSLCGLWTLLWHGLGCHVSPHLYEQWDLLRQHGHMGHVREYTPRDVSGFLSRLGFKPVRSVYRSYGPHTSGAVALRIRDVLESAVCIVLPSFSPAFSLICERI